MGKGTSNTSYASFTGRSGSTYYATWTFDVSAIPENATIDSVSCEAKVGVATTSNANAGKPTIQLYSADAAKGEAVVGGNSKTGEVVTLTTGRAWTRDELALCSIRISRYIVTSSDRSVRFYGADLTVVYTYQSEKFMLKLGGAWHDIARVFKKVNGIWVEQTELANVIEDGVRYKNGGEIESTRPNLISFTAALSFGSEVATYQAEEGMTWAQWVASSYNTDGFYVKDSDNYVYTPSNFYVYDSNGKTNVKKTDTVIAGYAYGAL